MRWMQDKPHFLENLYAISFRLFRPLGGRVRPGGPIDKLIIRAEKITKGMLFDCRMCGQCVLHSTGMTCPMTCPKNLRNGPCGGVRANGHCEIKPEMPCVWVQAWERSKKMPHYGPEILQILPPLNRRLQDTSAWVNEFRGKTAPPPGW